MASPPTATQRKLLEIIPRVTGSLSILGSSYILWDVLWHRRRQRTRLRASDRFLLGMSFCDIIASVSTPLILNLAVPPPFGSGNRASCNAQGFFSNFVTATALYTGCLAFGYLLSICYRWNEQRLRIVEMICHFSIVPFVLISGGVSIHQEIYNPTPIACTMTSMPPNCSGDECMRGESAKFWRVPFRIVPEYTSIGFSTIAMVMIYCKVRQMEVRASQWSFVTIIRNVSHAAAATGLLSPISPGDKQSTHDLEETAVIQMPPPEVEAEQQQPTQLEEAQSQPPSLRDEDQPQQRSDKNEVAPEICVQQYHESKESKLFEFSKETIAPSSAPLPRFSRKTGGLSTSSSSQFTSMSREVGIQAVCFIAAFLLTWTVPTIARCLQRIGGRTLGVNWLIAINVFLPLQGFWNALVYCRPKLVKNKLWRASRERGSRIQRSSHQQSG